MFRTARMHKFRAVILQDSREDVVAWLHEAGVTQLREISEQKVERRGLGEEISELSAILSKLEELREFLEVRPDGRKEKVGEVPRARLCEKGIKLLEELEPKITALRNEKENLERRKQQIRSQVEVIEGLRKLRLPLESLRDTENIKIIPCRIQEDRISEFTAESKKALSGKLSISILGGGRQRILLLACLKEDQPTLSPLIYRYEADILQIPELKGTPLKALQSCRDELKKLGKEEKILGAKIKKIATAHGRKIACIAELLEVQKERLSCEALFGYTDATAVLEGWIPKKGIGGLEEELARMTGGHYILKSCDPEEKEAEEVPVQLENPAVVRDFEYVTEMYGLPKYNEVDPTPILTFTFALFFAICLSDAGYGLLLGLFMISNVWIAKTFPKNLKHSMILCCIFTVVVGLLVGGFFGFGGGMWTNPLENPIPLLKLAVFLGFFHLIIAYGIMGALKDVFRKNWKGLAFERISKVLILVGFFGLGLCILGIGLHEFGIGFTFPKLGIFDAFFGFGSGSGIAHVFRVLFYSGLGLGIMGAVWMGKGVQGKVGGATNAVYGVLNMLSDMTSYTRLMALGIATGVIAFVINYILGLMLNPIFPSEVSVLNILLGGLILLPFGLFFLAAHSFNIFINSMGGFIHSMRLHFAEFFGKFYEGGGEKFTPFKVKRSYTISRQGGHFGS